MALIVVGKAPSLSFYGASTQLSSGCEAGTRPPAARLPASRLFQPRDPGPAASFHRLSSSSGPAHDPRHSPPSWVSLVHRRHCQPPPSAGPGTGGPGAVLRWGEPEAVRSLEGLWLCPRQGLGLPGWSGLEEPWGRCLESHQDPGRGYLKGPGDHERAQVPGGGAEC